MPLSPKIVLKGGKEKHIRHGHPWIFASAIERVEDSPQPGWTADVVTYDGRWVARAGYSPKSQLRARASGLFALRRGLPRALRLRALENTGALLAADSHLCHRFPSPATTRATAFSSSSAWSFS